MRLKIMLSLAALLSPSVFAQQAAPAAQDADHKTRIERANRMKAEAGRAENAAEERLRADTEACHKVFQVSNCLDDARRRHIEAKRAAQRIGHEGDEIAREVKREEVAEKDAKRVADAPQKAARQDEKATAFRAGQAAKEKAIAEKKVSLEKKAEEGRQKRAADQARYQQKRAAQAKKEAKAAEKRRARDAKRPAKGAKPDAKSANGGPASAGKGAAAR